LEPPFDEPEREDLLVVFRLEPDFGSDDLDFDDVRRFEPLADPFLRDCELDLLLVAILFLPAATRG
jgi:hypothetical protein